ncbi:hypothetical protein [Aureimonas jatrophae]|uniref:Uncharacterized protein n=1 Tax=Aureimonas jatrophae TaxID=1166073 RepID=A0A1H0FNH7_9HYPH|nr:hypothetical protein [Aureimonas jatrophae]MBB3949931.1 hypothetical protein [Aureimonas jatrophae]SDN96226.1 hypothetical protein SAMN05192530_102603 [Aureimonas jatrophae]
MDRSTTSKNEAERLFPSHDHRSEKGSAMRTIAAQTAATQSKSARLKALRLARDATIVVAPDTKKRAAKRKTGA